MSDSPSSAAAAVDPPTNPLVTALLTDMYQITMAYAHFVNKRHNDPAVFELFFRKNPFKGEYTIFAGLDEVLRFLSSFGFTRSDVDYLRTKVPSLRYCDPTFFDWLLQIDASQVKILSMKDGTVAYPRVPLIVVEAPLAVGQLVETTLLTLVNYPSLLTTNAARMVRAAEARHKRSSSSSPAAVLGGKDIIDKQQQQQQLPVQCTKVPSCIEFGLRRAQGPDGGFSASKYSTIGGFVGTSNVQAGKLCYPEINVTGTHAHSFVQAYSNLEEVAHLTIVDLKNSSNSNSNSNNAGEVKLLPRVLEYRKELTGSSSNEGGSSGNEITWPTNDGELAAFVAYAVAFPRACLCLIDTYDTLTSGLINFICVALALDDYGYEPIGIRLDSGDLAYLSMECATKFAELAKEKNRPFFHNLSIVVSNDINEAVLHELNEQDHAITSYGIGTNLVTCQSQPALGCVYKLVEILGKPRMKLSQDIDKVLIPGKKKPYRLYGKDERPILDVLIGDGEEPPQVGVRMLCRHPFVARKRVAVTPHRVEALHTLVFDGKVVEGANRTLLQAKQAVADELKLVRPDILRYINPTPYKVSVSTQLFDFLHSLWQSESPVPELS